jgi:CRISPR system Cascade subunit CasA
MRATFDLIESPWLPCIREDGTPVELGLRQGLAHAHELRELHAESPPVTAALHRLLLAVLHRVFGPASHKEWADLWNPGRWDETALDSYLDRWRDRFDLFHPERPFYQAADERVKAKSVASLIQEVASGNNPTLFDHHTDAGGLAVAPNRAARALVAVQAFGLAHPCDPSQKLYFTDGPCARGICFLVQGDCLFETLALNLLRYPDDIVMPHQADDRPAWEMDHPFQPPRTRPRGYLDYLTWQNRRVLFAVPPASTGALVNEMTVAPGLRLDSDVRDPMKHYHQDQKRGPRPLPFVEERALWRDSAALFQLWQAEYIPPRSFDWLAALADRGHLDQSQTRRCLALGLRAYQDRVDFYRADRVPLPFAYLREKGLVQHLQIALDMAETASHQLWGATNTLAALLLSAESDLEDGHRPTAGDVKPLIRHWGAERPYWSRLEIPFMEAVQTLPRDPDGTLEQWRGAVLRAAWEAFDHVAEGLAHDPRALKAVVRASGKLAAGLAKALPADE